MRSGKGGCTPEEATDLDRFIKIECPHLDLAGLMTIGSFDYDPKAGLNPDFQVNLEVGIAMGCTISPILFVMAMEVILKAAEDSAGPANLGGGCSMPPLKAFMDDTTIICSKEDVTR
ncbi:proline synthase co-transcribed bacterial homolog protein-like protein [Plakobranchus ocellatus]|uniref:Proline synthase co-transcribed bacterial homolog protein-like protein n=1 Tax=Plakobranchus ocellatus TaxID=259542 RepID=A0AAV4BZX5_9GAST|nr:proline synthase co-transcribed bacterial homolog protein-like protein [Plakobranchus ocellatus]